MTNPTYVDVEDGKNHHHQQQFQGNSNYPPPPQYQSPATGYQQPAPTYVSGYAVDGGRYETDHHRLPCCGIGIGWLLFILGFFIGAITWYIGLFLLLCNKNPREKPGYVACAIGAVIATIIIIVAVISGALG